MFLTCSKVLILRFNWLMVSSSPKTCLAVFFLRVSRFSLCTKTSFSYFFFQSSASAVDFLTLDSNSSLITLLHKNKTKTNYGFQQTNIMIHFSVKSTYNSSTSLVSILMACCIFLISFSACPLDRAIASKFD